MTGEATLSNEKNYTVFRFGNHVIRFAAPYSLEHYTEVKEWDNGYLVVMAKYKQNAEPEEEMIVIFVVLFSQRRKWIIQRIKLHGLFYIRKKEILLMGQNIYYTTSKD